jgi:hypothetical protein
MVNTTNKLKQMTAYDTFDIDGWNGELFDEDYCSDKTIDEIIDNALKDPWYCDYCLTKLLKVEDQVHEEGNYRDYCLWYCRKCRFWQACFRPDPSRYDIPPPDFHAYISKLREFDTNLPEGCSEELAMHIRQHPNLLHSFNPTRFEKFVADVFRANYANTEVLHVGKSHDGGVDVLLIDAENEKWLIQVKRRGSPSPSEGVGTIRDILGAMHLEEARIGIVVSTTKRFSQPAQKAAVKAGKVRNPVTIHLIDKGAFNRMLDPVLPDRPWLDPISEVDEEISSYLADQIPTDNQLYLFEELNLFN